MTAARRVALALLLAVSFAAPVRAQIVPRLIRFLQVDAAGKPIGKAEEVYCPASGCEAALKVEFEDATETYMASIQVVQRGIYIALNSRTLGTARVLNFSTGAPGPTFILTRGRERVVRVLHLIVVRDASVRAERGFDPDTMLSEGPVINRRRVPDLYLRTEVLNAEN